MKKTKSDYKEKFNLACRGMGIGDLTLGHRLVSNEPLSKMHWLMLYFALLAFQHQAKLIIADAIARGGQEPGG